MSKANKILMIGSEGFIGNHLIEFFLQKKYEVWGSDLNFPIKNNYHFLKNDFTAWVSVLNTSMKQIGLLVLIS